MELLATCRTCCSIYISADPPAIGRHAAWDGRSHWLPIAVDGTPRHEASYILCTLRGTTGPNQVPRRWLLRGSERWETMYAASQEINFDDELRKAANVSFKDTGVGG